LAAGADVHAIDDYALYAAVELGYLEIAKLLLEAGADVNACDGEPLICACNKSNLAMVILLVSHGADTSVLTDKQRKRIC